MQIDCLLKFCNAPKCDNFDFMKLIWLPCAYVVMFAILETAQFCLNIRPCSII